MDGRTLNFEFLSGLDIIASYARNYVYFDPATSLVKSRQILELLTELEMLVG